MSGSESVRAIVRRRRRATGRVAKISFSLEAGLVDAIRDAVRNGQAESASAFVESAVQEKLRWSRREILARDYVEAARDPAFIADVEETLRAFDATGDDGLTSR
jgi:hypothetical protein